MKNLSIEQFEGLCLAIGKKLNLPEKGIHVAGLFESNDSDVVAGWATLDSDNNIIKRYESIIDLFNEYEKQ